MSRENHDLSAEFDEQNYAVYLPALSGFYTQSLAKVKDKPETMRKDGPPKGFEYGFEGLDFLRKEDNYFRYRYALYSAGHAQLDLEKANADSPMVHERPDDTIIVGDSGGFQLATGVIKMNWENAKSANDPEREKLCEKILRWLEHTADWSMTLDVPALAAAPPLNKKTGLTSFQDTLDITLLNLDYFMKNRVPGATKFLNVLSGSTQTDLKRWYDAVIKYSDPEQVKAMGYTEDRTLEGFAYAGINALNIGSALETTCRLIDDGMLKECEWIHILGIGRTDYACYINSLQRELNKHHAPKLKISYDAASPFVSTAYGQFYGDGTYTKHRIGYNMGKAPDDKRLAFCEDRMPWNNPIMNRCRINDICVRKPAYAEVNGELLFPRQSKFKDKKKAEAENEVFLAEFEDQINDLREAGVEATFYPPELNRQDKETRTSWDIGSNMIMMGHNVWTHIDSVTQAIRLGKLEAHNYRDVSWRDWMPGKGKSSTNAFAEYVPGSVIYFDSLCRDLFDPARTSEERMQILKEAQPFLNTINARNLGSGNVFDSLFDIGDEGATDPESSYASLDDEKMVNLEQHQDDL